MFKKIHKSITARAAVALILFAGVFTPASARAGAPIQHTQMRPDNGQTAHPISPQSFLNPDGTLKLDGASSGSLDLQNWDVHLDTARGPVFAPEQDSTTGQWSRLGPGLQGYGPIRDEVWAIAVKGTDIYVGGSFTGVVNKGSGIDEADFIAKWDGTNWSALGSNGTGNGSLNGFVTSIVVSGDNIYVGGAFYDVNNNGTVLPNADSVARWDGTNWSALGSNGSGNGSLNGSVRDMAVSGGNLYVGGLFTDVNNNGTVLTAADYIARWDGTNWSALGSNGAENGSLGYVPEAIAVSGSDVYVGGHFTDVNNNGTVLTAADYIAKWDGTNWSALGSNAAGNGSLNNIVNAIAVSGNNVYAGGLFTNVNNKGTVLNAADNIARWDGANWSSLGAAYDGESAVVGSVLAIAVSGDTVYAGGYFRNILDGSTIVDTADYVARWDGAHWSGLGSNGAGDGSLNESVWSLAATPTALYAGGKFMDVNNNGTVLEDADHLAAYKIVPTVPSTLVVTKLTDTNDGACDTDCSLREAIANSYNEDTIKFGLSGTIVLGSALPAIDKTLVIDGSGQTISLDGAKGYRIFNVGEMGSLTVKNLTFQNGGPAQPCEYDSSMSNCGGAIYVDGVLTVVDSTFSGNSAFLGGAIAVMLGTANIEGTTFTGNSSAGYGGAIFNLIGVVNVENSTFYGNAAADQGGGIFNDFGALTLHNNTFSDNSASLGAGVFNSSGDLAFANNILANSASGGDCYNDSQYAFISSDINNLIETNAAAPNGCGTPASTSDPQLGTLADNGGFTQTMALLAGSPAIDAGNDPACAITDQRGVDRPQGSHCDMGAYEYAPNAQEFQVQIGNTAPVSHWISPLQSTGKSYAGLNNGPVMINSLSTSPLVASQRVIYGGGSYSEMMGLPKEQLSKEYWFPYYNNVAMDSQLRVSNVGGADTIITVYLGADKIDEYALAAGGATRKNYTGKNNGPLRVISSASNILATTRVLYNTNSYSELMGLPVEQLAKEYLFPYYNNVAMNSQLRVSNVGGADTTITVYLGTTQIDSYTLAAGGATRKNYTGKNSGPLRVTSSDSNVLATTRVLYNNNSYSELMGFPTGQLGQDYWYPVYDNVTVDSQLRVSNVGTDVTTITVYAGATQIDSYTLAAGGATRKNYTGRNTGPLHVVSSTQPVLTTIRMLYAGNSYYEMTGLPESQLSTQYFFPWYNNKAMNSELRLAVP
jgi:CSLREA domain-containing protein